MSQDIQQLPIHIYMNPIGKIRQIQRHLWRDVYLLDLCPIDCSIRTYIFLFLIFPSLCLFVLNKNALGCEKISVQLIAPFPDQFHAEKAMEVTQRAKIHRSVVLRNVCFLKEGLKKSTKHAYIVYGWSLRRLVPKNTVNYRRENFGKKSISK